MKYNFDEIIDRTGTNALNTDGFRAYIFNAGPERVFPYKDEEFVRMWVADMEFACAPEICEAMQERINRRIFGYTGIYTDDYYRALNAWCEKQYGWSVPKDELTFATGIIPALYQLVELICKKGDSVLMVTPAYGYFKHTAVYNDVNYVRSPLLVSGSDVSIDFDDFEKKAADPNVKVILWCHPQNPSGQVWEEDELRRIAQIAREHDVWLISDEIHCDILRTGVKHTPMAMIDPEYPKLVTCMSASKAFNLAGLQFSNIIIRDPDLRAAYKERDKNVGFVNPISLAAHQAAYQHGADWLTQMKTYLDENFRFVKKFLDTHFPKTKFEIPEATYLAWVHIGIYLPGVTDLPAFFADHAGVLLEGGDSLFVGNAQGYIRLNLAMPRSIIQTGLERMKVAIGQEGGQA